jgi:hypothetical protein
MSEIRNGFINSTSSYGKWQFLLYQQELEPCLGHLIAEKDKYYILDSSQNVILCIPSGNIACVINLLAIDE